jgi:uncharacterized NAD(P)/FAD-binding protein YdhS
MPRAWARRGLGTRDVEHLLNVRAANMSAFPDDAGHFLRWLGVAKGDQVNRFVPRLTYGLYLRELLMKALAQAPGRLHVIEQAAQGIVWQDTHARSRWRKARRYAHGRLFWLWGILRRRFALAHLLPTSVLVNNPWVRA